jgi:hypothetical protein
MIIHCSKLVAAVLDAAERRLGNRGHEVVDGEIAGFDTFRQAIGVAG